MRLLNLCLLATLAACGGSSTPNDDLSTRTDAATSLSLTVNNTQNWCTVVVTAGSAAPVTFTDASMAFSVTSGESIGLKADPLPTFEAVKWTGVTSTTDTATYTATSATTQSVTACCALSDGTGC